MWTKAEGQGRVERMKKNDNEEINSTWIDFL